MKTWVDDVRFGISDSLLALVGMLGEKLYQECLAQIVHVFPCCLVCDAHQLCNVVIVDFLACIVDQMVGNLAQGIRMPYVETLLDVFCDDSLQKTLHIASLIANALNLRESSYGDVFHKGTLDVCHILCCDAFRVKLVVIAIFSEGEGEKVYLVVSPCEMCRQLAAQKFGVASCYDNMQVGAKQAVYEQMPSFHILHLIEKYIFDVSSIYLVDAGEDGVEVFYSQLRQSVVVKVGIAIFDLVLQENLVA